MNGDQPLTGASLQAFVGAADQLSLRDDETVDAIDATDIGNIKLADFTKPRACEQADQRNPETRVAWAVMTALGIPPFAIDAAPIDWSVKYRPELAG